MSDAAIKLRLLTRSPALTVNESGEHVAGRLLALVSYLVLTDHVRTRDELCDLLWDPVPGRDTQRAFRELLSRARRILPSGVLQAEGRTVAVDTDAIWCDVVEFRRAAVAEPATAAAMYEADFMAGGTPSGASEYSEWADSFGRQLKREFSDVLRTLVEQSVTQGEFATASEYAERLWHSDPEDLSAVRLLLGACIEGGRSDVAGRTVRAIELHYDGDVPQGVAALMTVARELATTPAARTPERAAPSSVATVTTATPHSVRAAKRTVLVSALATAALVGIIAAVVITKNERPTEGLYGGGGTIVVQLLDGSARAFRFTGPLPTDTASIAIEHLDSLGVWRSRYSPVAQAFAFQCPVPRSDERHSCVKYLETGVTFRVPAGGTDEVPIGWSPDGKWLLVVSGRRRLSPPFNYDIYAAEVATGRLVRVSNDPWESSAAWSPDGSRFAVTSHHADGDSLRVRTFDGRLLRRFWFEGATFTYWSNDGRMMLVLERREVGSAAILIGADGEARTWQAPLRVLLSAVWSPDDSVVGFLGANTGDEPWRLVLCEVSECSEPLLQIDSVASAIWLPSEDGYLHRITAAVRADQILAGDRVAIDVNGADQHGATVPVPYVTINVDQPDVAWVDSLNVLHAVAPGSIRLITSAAGWRADTISVAIQPAKAPHLLLEETWEAGLDTLKWKVWGAPVPTVVFDDSTHAMRNNGDDMYPSGVVSRQRYSLAGGVTLAWRQKVPWTGDLWQEVWVDLFAEQPDAFYAAAGDPLPRSALIAVRAPQSVGQPPVPKLQTGCGSSMRTTNTDFPDMPVQARDDNWHDFALQVHPNGSCELIVDGSTFIKNGPSDRLNLDTTTFVLSISGRTWRTNVLVDDIRLWQGPRWAVRSDGSTVELQN